MVASQRFALSAPNGALRRRDSDNPRAATSHCQQLPERIFIEGGEIPHPGALISEYVKDGDVVRCALGDKLTVSNIGSPKGSAWATAAFTASGANLESVDDGDHEEADDSDPFEQESQAAFMRVILASQLFDYKRIEELVISAWQTVPRVLPRISPEISQQLCGIVLEYAIVLLEVFECYSPEGRMNFSAYKEFVDDAELFSAKDVSRQVSRIFRRTIKGEASDTLDMGGFLVSLVLAAQIRHNDTLDDMTAHGGCAEALSQLLRRRIPPMAERLNLDRLFRKDFCETENLYEMRQYHNDVFLVFDHYSSKMQRDLPLTITLEYATEILYQSGLIDTPEDFDRVRKVAEKTKGGILVGRAPLDASMGVEELSSEELTFAEFFEVCLRVGVKEYLGKPFEDDNNDEQDVMNSTDAMLHALQDVGECLTKPKPRKLASPREDERDRRRRK